MHVGVRERIATENDVLNLSQGDIGPVPDGAEKCVV